MPANVVRGYLPPNYYADRLVYKRQPPQLRASQYPNKIDIDGLQGFAIVAGDSNPRLHSAYQWMSAHPYVRVNVVHAPGDAGSTGNVAIEAYQSDDRAYAMITFRAATEADERTNHLLESHGMSRRGPCPAPVTALLCRSGVNIQSVWQWLNIHYGRVAYLVDEPLLFSNIAVVQSAAPRQRRPGQASDGTLAPSAALRYTLYDEANVRRTRNLQGPERSTSTLRHMVGHAPRRTDSNASASLRQLRRSGESAETMLPAYEPPPPNDAIGEDCDTAPLSFPAGNGHCNGARPPVSSSGPPVAAPPVTAPPPLYWDVAEQTEYGRQYTGDNNAADAAEESVRDGGAPSGFMRVFTRSMPMLSLATGDDEAATATHVRHPLEIVTDGLGSDEGAARVSHQEVVPPADRMPSTSGGTARAAAPAHRSGPIHTHLRRARLAAATNPEVRSTRFSSWFSRLFHM
ncbi:hypothetical protein IWQ56_002294 [Coemansia nantahalensis]|nr:hypothetical protein IWQ56_002294 [Coemansia nantahalensis]